MTDRRALTVRQPYAGLIAANIKKVENRSTLTKWRGPVAIHAGLDLDDPAFDLPHVRRAIVDTQLGYRTVPIPTSRGVILAVATITGCHEDTGCCRPWGMADRWHWVLDNVRPLALPVPAMGRLGLWRLHEATAGAVDAQLATVTR